MTLVYRLVIAAAMVVSGGVHAYLYLHGYGHIPTVGTGFLVQASVFCAVGVLLAVGAPRWFGWASGLLSAGALAAFGLSRTVGLFGFVETGWEPAPYALISVIVEAVAVLAVAAWLAQMSRQRSNPGAGKNP
ncbi:hypothetical protein LAUMK4_05646 [Mycobacterium persicum]|nr:hypothetical protein MASS_1p0099 [Mycobacteroides abscessus subsp. bolletii 50594]ETZ56994.1 putative membrane protein [Mycobacterium sp. MAC_011194_8550]ETZ96423.1 putative membrane protein [Mycobacterium kansasii 824]EUA09712.1 putative membrane protein [Mycobacterium kansasii 662]OOK65318.1 putative membrane protein [Mycobacterium kansasii]SLE89890.1 Uncharacterised protein [Mycobacteroides abscessus subsp. abscessus]VBA31980.1 hypothetical protein LAUMK4_05646 [Mycobacterium persicum]